MTLLEQAKEFRAAFEQEMLDNISRYGFIKQKLYALQVNLIKEEYSELIEASEQLFADPENNVRREELLKELCDLVFVCYQFAAAFNLDLDTAMDRVYESNMSKLDEEGSPIRRQDGKILKGPNYAPPQFDHLYPQSNTHYDTHGK